MQWHPQLYLCFMFRLCIKGQLRLLHSYLMVLKWEISSVAQIIWWDIFTFSCNTLGASVYRAMWASSASRTIMTVWKTSVNTEPSVWMLSTATPASVKRVSGESPTKRQTAWTETVTRDGWGVGPDKTWTLKTPRSWMHNLAILLIRKPC